MSAIGAAELTGLGEWMDGEGLGRGPIENVQHLAGGTQNIMLSFTRRGRRFILRRAPEHPRRHSNASILREMQVLEALATTGVPHARLIAGCADQSVLGDSVFYLMEPVDGFNAAVTLPALHRNSEEVRHDMGLEMVDGLAALGNVDYKAIGLGTFGKPDGFLERQVPRWMGALDSYPRRGGYRPLAPTLVEDVANWLETHRPSSWSPGFLHGDFHVANVMFETSSAKVAAIVDWEMSTIGDPLLDLGWLIASWPESPGESDLTGTIYAAAGGLATESELVERYRDASGRDLTHIDWYVVLGCFKLAIVLDGTYARSTVGEAQPETGAKFRTISEGLLRRAKRRISNTK